MNVRKKVGIVNTVELKQVIENGEESEIGEAE